MDRNIKDLIEMQVQPTPESNPSTAKQRTISAFSPDGFDTAGDPQLELMVNAAVDFCSDMADGKEPRWLSLLGPSGSGKTYLTTMVYKWVKKHFNVDSGAGPNGIDLYRPMIFVDSFRWVKTDAAENWNYTPRICDAFFVCIDDLAAPRDTTGHLANCYSDVSQQRDRKWTIITSNLLSGDIRENVDTRVASRLYRHGSVVIETNAQDWNLR